MNHVTNRHEPPRHVVLGAGQIGTRVAKLLTESGERVRLVQRREAANQLPLVDHVSGDIRNFDFAEQVTRGAKVVYDCMNPPYHEWPELLLPIARGALHGATRAGAKLVALDCLYMYGKAEGPMREDSPLLPASKKGALRVELARERLSAHARGDVTVTIGRASDFFGENLPYSCWSERFFQRLYAGRPGECMGDPDLLHSYTYAGDVARALVTLGASDAANGQIWHLPTAPAESTRSLTARLGRELGLEADVKRLPKILLRAAGVFSPFLREVLEMTYQWEMPFVLDDARFRETFGYGATSLDEQVRRTAAWARTRFGKAGGVSSRA